MGLWTGIGVGNCTLASIVCVRREGVVRKKLRTYLYFFVAYFMICDYDHICLFLSCGWNFDKPVKIAPNAQYQNSPQKMPYRNLRYKA